jgi:hypothetical protein
MVVVDSSSFIPGATRSPLGGEMLVVFLEWENIHAKTSEWHRLLFGGTQRGKQVHARKCSEWYCLGCLSHGMCNRAQSTRTAFAAQSSEAPRTWFHCCLVQYVHAMARLPNCRSVSPHCSGRWYSVGLPMDNRRQYVFAYASAFCCSDW